MNRTLINGLTALVLTALGTSLASAVLVESFETHPLMKNSSGAPPNNPPYTNVTQSTVAGVTDGTYSLTASFTNADYSWMYKAVANGGVTNLYYGASTYFQWYRHKTLKIDLHRPALTWGWNLEFAMAINGPQGWQQNQLVPWLWQNADESSSQTLTWDYSAIRDTVGPSGGYWQLAMMARGNVAGGGTVYVDNLRFEDLVPAIGFTFPTDVQNWAPQTWGTALAAAYWDATDAQTNASSGSLLCFCDFANAATNQTAVFQVWNFGPDTRDYARLSFDVKVDASLSTLTSSGDYGGVQVVLRGNDINYTPIGTLPIPASATNDFLHFEIPLYQPLSTNMVGINLIFGGTNLQGAVWYYVDNVLLNVETNPPTLALQKALPGLELNACAASVNQRQSVRTLAGTNGWVGRPGQVDYSLNINEGVPATAAGMMAYLFLIPTANANPTALADYAEANGIYLEIVQQANGLATAALRFKTNAPNSNGIRYANEGVLAVLSNAPMQGTWTLGANALGSPSQASLSAPGGASTNFTLPADLVAAFTGSPSPAYVYWGVQPNFETNLGQYANLARVQITGLASPFDQIFTSQATLAANALVVSADNPAGVRLRPTNTVYRLSWNAPSPGFSLYTATALDAAWSSAGLPVMAARQRNVVHVPTTALPAGQGYFRLQNP